MSSDPERWQLETQRVLHGSFGYEQFRAGQDEIVTAIGTGKDVLAILPTGGGKSLCYQVPGLVLGGTTLVISPLIALMEDQVSHLERVGVRATVLNSTLRPRDRQARIQRLREGYWQFVYVAPETCCNPGFLRHLAQTAVPLIAIDEAHCLTQWGHEFRPAYREVANALQKLHPRPVIAAFTATATPSSQQEMIEGYRLQDPKVISLARRRTNLFLEAKWCQTVGEQERATIGRIVQNPHCDRIIYTTTRHQAVYFAQLLQHLGFRARAYHAGIPSAERTAILSEFTTGKLPCVVATNAFGMGIDKPEIREVIHVGLPGDIESYVQEAGRAGRDMQPASCYLWPTPTDIATQSKLLEQTYPDPATIQLLTHAVRHCLHGSVSTTLVKLWQYLDNRVLDTNPPLTPTVLRTWVTTLAAQELIKVSADKQTLSLIPTWESRLSYLAQRWHSRRVQLTAMIEFVAWSGCRHQYLQSYLLGLRVEKMPTSEKCESCENCLRPKAELPDSRSRKSQLDWFQQMFAHQPSMQLPGVGRGWQLKNGASHPLPRVAEPARAHPDSEV